MKIFIGIDPAFRTNGFAVAVIDEDRTVAFRTFKDGFLSFSSWLLHDVPSTAIVAVENSNLQGKTLFNRYRTGSTAKQVSTALSVGKNMATSQMTTDLCKAVLGVGQVLDISPEAKGRKLSHKEATSLARLFKIKNWPASTNQDKRDAFKLATMAMAATLKRI